VWALGDDGGSGAAEPASSHDDGHEREHGDDPETGGEPSAAHDHGVAVHDSTGGREPTAEDEANADAFYDAVTAGTERYQDIDVATASGYAETSAKVGGDGPIKHYMRRGGGGAAELDAEWPQGLVYYVDDDQATLIGAVFTSRDEEPEQPGGPLTVWHDHSPMGCPETRPDCPAADGIDEGENPPKMLHVWLFDGADRFAHGFPEAISESGVRQKGDPLPFDV
jgi:hypothetical protein